MKNRINNCKSLTTVARPSPESVKAIETRLLWSGGPSHSQTRMRAGGRITPALPSTARRGRGCPPLRGLAMKSEESQTWRERRTLLFDY